MRRAAISSAEAWANADEGGASETTRVGCELFRAGLFACSFDQTCRIWAQSRSRPGTRCNLLERRDNNGCGRSAAGGGNGGGGGWDGACVWVMASTWAERMPLWLVDGDERFPGCQWL